MDIAAISVEPITGSLRAAYRGIRFVVQADTICPPTQPMYCDVYIDFGAGSAYYKTIVGYPPPSGGGIFYVFDIQDAVQEAIQTYIPTINSVGWQQSNADLRTSQSTTFCKFRGSTYDGDGLLVPNGPIPIQATASTPAVDGGGTGSNAFYVLNASILPSLDSIYQNRLEQVLQLKQNTLPTVPVDYMCYTLSDIPKTDFFTALEELPKCSTIYADDYGSLPIEILDWPVDGALSTTHRNCQVYVYYQNNGVGAVSDALLINTTLVGVGTWYLPCGLKEIFFLAPGVEAAFRNVNNNIYYHIVIFDVDAAEYAYVSPKFKVGTRVLERKRLWFLNTYGHFDQVTFARTEENLVTTSSEQFVPYTPTSPILPAQMVGRKRYNVRAHDEITVTGHFAEALLPWLKELMMSPLCMMEDVALLDNEAPTLTAVKVLDGTFKTRKTVADNRAVYEVGITIRPAVDYITLRN